MFLGCALSWTWVGLSHSHRRQIRQPNSASSHPIQGTNRTRISVSKWRTDVDACHALAQANGHAIVYPLTDEPWGVRRFFVTDPNGVIVNVVTQDRKSVV